MGLRTLCFVGAIVVGSGWLRWVLVAAALVLPYVAVVMANAASPKVAGTMPEGLTCSANLSLRDKVRSESPDAFDALDIQNTVVQESTKVVPGLPRLDSTLSAGRLPP